MRMFCHGYQSWPESRGGIVLVSDDLALLGPDARVLLDEVLARGREADAGAASLSSAP
jgi:hypothetical protein